MLARLRTFQFSLLSRSAVFGFAAAGLFCVCPPLSVCGQQPPKADKRYEPIDEEAGRELLKAFRSQRLDGDYCFRFELQHMPSDNSKAVRYYGTMWGSWNDVGPITRIEMATEPNTTLAGSDAVIEMIFQNGAEPEAWLRRSRTEDFVRLKGDLLHQTILPGIVYTPFDLQMPFLYWENYTYEGAVRVRTRIAQTFLMIPTEGEAGVKGVRIGIDDEYDALRRIEVIANDNSPRSEFTVESFKRVQKQWIVKRIVLRDNATRDRTRFNVRSASVGLILPREIFVPARDVSFPIIPESMFKDM